MARRIERTVTISPIYPLPVIVAGPLHDAERIRSEARRDDAGKVHGAARRVVVLASLFVNTAGI